MGHALSTPKIENYIRFLDHQRNTGFGSQFTYDDKTYILLDELFDLLSHIEPSKEGRTRELWLTAHRGPIEDFGDYEELLAEGEVQNREEFENLWKAEFPDEVSWYHFSAVEDKSFGYRSIFLGHRMVLEEDQRLPKSFPADVSEFAQWLVDSVHAVLNELDAGTYNDRIRKSLPAQHRTGTITRGELWDIFPDRREEFFQDLSLQDINAFVANAVKQTSSNIGRLSTLTANDFYLYCTMGYAANHYDGGDLSPKEQYFHHADGRDDGLCDITPDSPAAFDAWYQDSSRLGGHPWEVCRGGNSTHIDLYVFRDEGGYYLCVAGNAWSRTVEAVKFFLALYRAGVPVCIRDADILTARLTEQEKVGIVPKGIYPVYCQSLFPDEKVIDFINFPDWKTEQVEQHCVWQEIPEVRLVPQQPD